MCRLGSSAETLLYDNIVTDYLMLIQMRQHLVALLCLC